MITADRDRRSFIAKHHFGYTCGQDANPVLACIVALNDGDVGVAHFLFQLSAYLLNRLVTRWQQGRYRRASDACRRPQKDLGGTVLAKDLRFNVAWIDAEMPPEMHAEAQTVQ